MTKRLTELGVARTRPVPGRRVEKPDGLVPGLQLRVSETGGKSYSLLYRIAGKQRRMTLGRHPQVSLAEARRRARAALEQVDRSEDPAGERRERGRKERDTVRAVCEQYLELHVRRNGLRRAGDVERMLHGQVLPHWDDRPIQSITRRDALDLVDAIASRAPIMANRVASLLKRVFSWAVERGVLEASPVATLRPPARERSRERVLEDAELAAIWRACDPLGPPHGAIIRLLVLTGARRAEVTGMRWAELDLERALWVKPGERTKSGREHRVPLPAAAVDLIRRLPVIDGSPLVFPSRGGGPVTSQSGPKARLDRLSGVSGWCVHDLRRTTASGLARLGASDLVVAGVLDHSRSAIIGVTSRYDRHGRDAEQRRALEAWAAHVERLAAGEGAKVVALHRTAG